MTIASAWTLLLALAAAPALAAACGLRAFLPLLAIGLAGRFHLLTLAPGAAWLESDPALVALAAAALLEIAGDKIPAVDHALDAIGIVIRPAAAWVGAYALLAHLPGPWSGLLGLALGGGALAVHAVKAKTRLGSSALTFGLGNPLLSFVEDGTVLGLVLAAILAPLIALVGLLGLAWLLTGARRRLRLA